MSTKIELDIPDHVLAAIRKRFARSYSGQLSGVDLQNFIYDNIVNDLASPDSPWFEDSWFESWFDESGATRLDEQKAA